MKFTYSAATRKQHASVIAGCWQKHMLQGITKLINPFILYRGPVKGLIKVHGEDECASQSQPQKKDKFFPGLLHGKSYFP